MAKTRSLFMVAAFRGRWSTGSYLDAALDGGLLAHVIAGGRTEAHTGIPSAAVSSSRPIRTRDRKDSTITSAGTASSRNFARRNIAGAAPPFRPIHVR